MKVQKIELKPEAPRRRALDEGACPQGASQAVFTVMVSARERLEGLTRELFRFDY
jgi:hypothetical protein